MYIRKLEFYTDGSWSSKTKNGGWAAICIEDGTLIDTHTGLEPYTTNNRMELCGFLSALESVATIESRHTEVTIYVDSAYIANCINNGWYRNWLKNNWRTSDRQDVKNKDLWSPIVALYIRHSQRLKLRVVKVQSHAGHKWNEYVDELCVLERKKLDMLDITIAKDKK